jgi:hypothetical protein
MRLRPAHPFALALAVELVTIVLCASCTGTESVPFGQPDAADASADADAGGDAPGDLAADVADDAATDSPQDGPADSHGDGIQADADSDPSVADATDAVGDPDPDAVPDAPLPAGSGTWADPWVIDRFPYEHAGDTSTSSEDVVDSYACAPATSEAGPEVVYRIEVPRHGILAVEVDDSAQGVDVDIHLLDSDGETCRVRDNTRFFEVVFAGDVLLLSVDTWTNSGGTELAGSYVLTVDLHPLPGGDCRLEVGAIEMFNRPEPLMLPAVGAVVREAHLVTTEEFPGTWPTSLRDGIEAHYALTQAVSGYVMARREPWAPAGEGGSEFGQGSTSRPPPLDETWYVNMYWRNRPARGTRMLVLDPATGDAVVGAAGYETGPGSAARLGGATEEIHHALGSTHGSRLLMGFLADQAVPFGPIACD